LSNCSGVFRWRLVEVSGLDSGVKEGGMCVESRVTFAPSDRMEGAAC